MRTFECDYTEGAHPKILDALYRTNLEQMSGYGCDPYTGRAAEKIKAAIGAPVSSVTFLVGGTQTNMIAIDLLLAPYEGVLSPGTGHINVHEAGASIWSARGLCISRIRPSTARSIRRRRCSASARCAIGTI